MQEFHSFCESQSADLSRQCHAVLRHFDLNHNNVRGREHRGPGGQSCALAPNGFYHLSDMKMNVEGKAMGSRFGQNMTFAVSDLTPQP